MSKLPSPVKNNIAWPDGVPKYRVPGTVRSAAAPELPCEGQKHRGRVPESCNYARLGETPIRHNVRNVYLMFSVLGIIYTGDTRHSPDSHNTNNNNHHEHCMQGAGDKLATTQWTAMCCDCCRHSSDISRQCWRHKLRGNRCWCLQRISCLPRTQHRGCSHHNAPDISHTRHNSSITLYYMYVDM